MTHQAAALVGRGVAGAQPHGGLVHRHAEALRRQPDAVQRGPQVLLHVHRQRSQG